MPLCQGDIGDDIMEQITKSQLQILVETEDSLQYMGTLTMGNETRVFYRSTTGAAYAPSGYKIVYVVD